MPCLMQMNMPAGLVAGCVSWLTPRIPHAGLSGNGMDMTTVAPDGSFKRSRVFAKPEEAFSVRTATTWLPRDGLNAALYQHVCDHYGDAVTVEFSTKVVDIMIPQAPGQPLGVVTAPCGEGGAAGEQRQLHCKLMVGADGANSRVREALQRAQPGQGWDREEKPSASSGLHFRVRTPCGHRLRPTAARRRSSADTGATLCLQVLPLPPCPKLCDSAGVLQNTQAAAFAGTPVNGDAPLRLGLLPIKDNTRPRTANFILWPEHNFWKITEPAALYSYLQQAFPQVQYWRDLVPEAEAKRFLSTEPGRFSHPQACGRLLARFEDAQAVVTGEGDAAASIQGSAVMLLGDAAHVFPPGATTAPHPLCEQRVCCHLHRCAARCRRCGVLTLGVRADLGQGVNSAILDVFTLSTSLERHRGDSGAALVEYESVRLPESKALVDIMVVRPCDVVHAPARPACRPIPPWRQHLASIALRRVCTGESMALSAVAALAVWVAVAVQAAGRRCGQVLWHRQLCAALRAVQGAALRVCAARRVSADHGRLRGPSGVRLALPRLPGALA